MSLSGLLPLFFSLLSSPDDRCRHWRRPHPQQGDQEAVKVVVAWRGRAAFAVLILALRGRAGGRDGGGLAFRRGDVALADQGDQVAAVLQEDGGCVERTRGEACARSDGRG